MDYPPRHVICVLGNWDDFSSVRSIVAAHGEDYLLDEEYSQLQSDARMSRAFEASVDRFAPTFDDEDWQRIQSHSAVAYILSPPMSQESAEAVSTQCLRLVGTLLEHGGLAAKSESAGLAHGRTRWLELAAGCSAALKDGDEFRARATLFWAWVQRIIHDDSMGVFYSIGMHLLGQPDTEIEDSLEPLTALQWIDMMGLYLVADKPQRPLLDGEGFRLTDAGPRRLIRRVACERYEEDDFFHNPFGYCRLIPPDQVEK